MEPFVSKMRRLRPFFATDVRRFKNCLLPLHVGNVWQTTCVAIHPNNITIMKKQEYARVNKEWLAEKANEEGVNELPGGIYYKVLKTGLNDDRHPSPRSIVTAHYTGRTINGKKFDSSLGARRSPFAFATSSTDGSSPCSACVWATSGRCISPLRKAMANSRSPASPATRPSFSR